MKLRHLRVFLAVADELHFGRAAQRLHVAQPAVSQTVAALENELGVTLFDRSRRRVRLTEAGQAYRAEVEDVFRHLDRASTVAREADAGVRGTLNVGFTAVCTLSALPDLLVDFMQLHPDVSVRPKHVGTVDQIEGLRLGTIDVGFSILPGEHAEVQSRLVASDELHLFFPADHALARFDRVPMLEALNEPFLLMSREREPCVHGCFERICDEHGRRAEVVMEVDHLESLFAFVGAGLGVSLAPSIASRLRLDGVVTRPVEPAIPAGISVMWRNDETSPATSRFLKHLRQRI